MKEMLKLEWMEWKNKLWKLLIWPLLLLFAVFLCYKINNKLMFTGANNLFLLPEPVLAFLGLNGQIETGSISFFLKIAVIPAQVWFAWHICNLTFCLVEEDFHKGRIFEICNQLYSRVKLAKIKFVCINALFFLIYFIWNITYLLLRLFGSYNQSQRLSSLTDWLKMTFLSILIYSMLASLCYVIASRGKYKNAEGVVNLLVFGSFLLANCYKVLDLLYEFLNALYREFPSIYMTAKRIEIMHNVYPIYWLNPFNEYNMVQCCVRAAICLALMIICYTFSIRNYRKRNLLIYM